MYLIKGKLKYHIQHYYRKEGKHMGEQTTLTTATTGKESLRTTVPISIIKNFKLKAGDKLDWAFDIKEGKMIIVVQPVKIEDKKLVP